MSIKLLQQFIQWFTAIVCALKVNIVKNCLETLQKNHSFQKGGEDRLKEKMGKGKYCTAILVCNYCFLRFF